MALIELIHVSKIYEIGGERVKALDDVSLKVEEGEFVAVTGASGSGKTTLMNLIGALDRPDSGFCRFDGQDLGRLSDRALSRYRNREIGFIFQAFYLEESFTALENVMLPLLYAGIARPEREERARLALTRVGLGDRLRHRPCELSGGQRQRVCIARALAGAPRVILADEPTGNLDKEAGGSITELLRGLNRAGYTVILVTHDPAQAAHAKRRIEIERGRVIRDEKIVTEYLASQPPA